MATYLAYQHPTPIVADNMQVQHMHEKPAYPHGEMYGQPAFAGSAYTHPLNPIGMSGDLHPMGVAPAAVGVAAFGGMAGGLVNGGSGCGASGPRKRKSDDDHTPTPFNQPSLSPPRAKRFASQDTITPSLAISDPHHAASALYLSLAQQPSSTIVSKPIAPTDSFPSSLASPFCLPIYNTNNNNGIFGPGAVRSPDREECSSPSIRNITMATYASHNFGGDAGHQQQQQQQQHHEANGDSAMMDVEHHDQQQQNGQGFRTCMGDEVNQWVPSGCGSPESMRWGGNRWEGC
ncbi:hypothetical protein HDV00_007154 [Rhizophlyctis rosea]|nr:hypothetical protein HDV00_007154 [Rhizophlyctis rosea]